MRSTVPDFYHQWSSDLKHFYSQLKALQPRQAVILQQSVNVKSFPLGSQSEDRTENMIETELILDYLPETEYWTTAQLKSQNPTFANRLLLLYIVIKLVSIVSIAASRGNSVAPSSLKNNENQFHSICPYFSWSRPSAIQCLAFLSPCCKI